MKVMETSAYFMFIAQFVAFSSYLWWSSFVPVSLVFPTLLLPAVVGLLLNGIAIKRNRKAVLVWVITVWYIAFGSVVFWDWIK
jgi:hypothetical protein